MSCQKVLSLLSAYVDGEVQPADGEFIESHLATCASCAHELEMLQRTTAMLGNTPELDPPAFLLEQIEAATVKRPSVWGRLRAVFSPVQRVPEYARWAVAGVAAAGILAAILVSQPGTRHTVRYPATQQPADRVVATEPADQPTADEKPEIKPSVSTTSQANSVRRAIALEPRRRTARTHTGLIRQTASGKIALPASDAASSVSETAASGELEENPAPESSVVEETATSPTEVVAEATPSDSPEVEIVKVPLPSRETKLTQHDVLSEVRSDIVARSRQRKIQPTEERIEGKKYSVELASVRF